MKNGKNWKVNLNIISIDKSETFIINWIEIFTVSGNIVIKKNHSPLIIELEENKNIIFETEDLKIKSFFIKNGFFHSTRDSIQIFII